MKFPQDLKYTKSDEWLRIEGDAVTVGVTDFAQDQLSDIVYLEYALSEGDSVNKGDVLGTIESVKASSEVYLPVSGKVLAVNEALLDAPEAVNSDPYGAAWMVKIELRDKAELDGLMDAAAYEADTGERE